MKNATELTNNRDVNTCGVGFKTVIPTHPANLKHSNYISEYNGKYVDNTRGKTVSEWQKTKAGSFNPVPE